MGRKAAETAHSINNIFGLGTANERAVQWWFKKQCKKIGSAKETGTLTEDEECRGQLSEVDSNQLRPVKTDLLTTT